MKHQQTLFCAHLQYAAKEDTEAVLSVGEKRNSIDPDWVTVDRIVAKQDKKGTLLVKLIHTVLP